MHILFAAVGLVASAFADQVAHAQPLDHLTCYQIKDSLTVSGLISETTPNFSVEAGCKISPAKYFCTASLPSGVAALNKKTKQQLEPLPFSIAPRQSHRLCYKIKCPKRPFPLPVQTITDPFGSRSMSKFTASFACVPAVIGTSYCGDGSIGQGEECEPGKLNGTTCQALGYHSGTLSCGPGCQFDTKECKLSTCGNGVVESPESCDQGNFGGMNCSGLGFASGTLTCTEGCGFDVTGCAPYPPPGSCGNGVVQGTESCDGANLAGASCISLGFTSGALACTPGCGFDVEGCHALTFPATGQTTCFNDSGTAIPCGGTGQDGAVQAGASLAYTDNGNGTITDLNTGLTWEKLSDDFSVHDKSNVYPWASAIDIKIATLNTPPCFAGFCDWRLPNVKELSSLLDYQQSSPAVTAVFNTNCNIGCTVTACSCTVSAPATSYWSSTSISFHASYAWSVSFVDGSVGGTFKLDSAYVRAVRGGT